MKSKVIVYTKLPESILESIKEVCELVYFDKLDSMSYPRFLEHLRDTDGILGAGLEVDSTLLESAPNLKIVSNISVGYDNLDIPELTKRGILATNISGVLVETTADTMMALILSTARRLCELDQYVKQRMWHKQISADLFGLDVHQKTLGIIGLGEIGSAVARRANLGFGMEVIYHNRTRNEIAEQRYNAIYCDEMSDLLKKSDFILLMTPLTSETKNLIGKKEFSMMKPTAIFINGSRGETVDEEALINALKNKTILAAGLDVYKKEPIEKDNPLLNMKNVVTLPHMGSATGVTRFNMALLAAKNLLSGIKGEVPSNLINNEVLERP